MINQQNNLCLFPTKDPASIRQECEPAPYTSPEVWNFSQLTGFPLPEVRTNSCLDAPISDGRQPVVVFTPGYTGTFTDYTFLFEHLASRGYVVAAVDQTYMFGLAIGLTAACLPILFA